MFLFKNWYFLAKNMTDAELALEPVIAELGERYRAQWLFAGLKHVVDFALLDRKIIIEVDGKSHNKPDQKWKDITHTIALEQAGWRVVRCTNEEVMANPWAALSECLARVESRPSLEELRTALGQLPAPPKRARAKRRKSGPSPRPVKAPLSRKASSPAQKRK